MNAPTDLHYAKSHEWLRLEGDTGTVGVTDHAQHELSDVVYVELPTVGAHVDAGQQICVIESVKAASDIYSPVAGTVTEVNQKLISSPANVNTDPYGEGWIFKLKLDSTDVAGLLSATQYSEQIGG